MSEDEARGAQARGSGGRNAKSLHSGKGRPGIARAGAGGGRPAGGKAQPGPPGLAAREAALAILIKVIRDRVPLPALLDEASALPGFKALSAQDKALVRAMLDTALRHRGEIEMAITRRLERPLDAAAHRLSALLHLGAAQILYLDVPDHAAINLAVTAAGRDRRTGRTKGLVNSVLRRIARERSEVLAGAEPEENAPGWLRTRWLENWGAARAEAIFAAHAETPPLDLSVRGDPAEVAALLGGSVLATGSVRLARRPAVSTLAGYNEGLWWVQDAAAAVPAQLLGEVAGRRVADLCAAPGGKTAQLAASGAHVTAVEKSRSRVRRLAGNLSRLRLSAELAEADILSFTPAEPFDAILLDAPCTATGTARRHPDLVWTKAPEEIASLALLQAKMLERVAGWLKPGGILVYATCSLEPEEGERQAAAFTAGRGDVEFLPLTAGEFPALAAFITPEGYFRSLPGMPLGEGEAGAAGMDGFFAARWRRAG
ncbi:transcription antitermination factor NusB [Afifella sp. IM 167]|uniref:RsmB/NOP family class I SAM-dependent RNA methyltransferase n=1 Tax=Afifella sp. IM 167 TaxID=2033586 RepID=UPI001CCEA0C6